MTFSKSIQLFCSICIFASCAPTTLSIHLTNNLNVERQNETVEILIAELPDHWLSKIDKIGIYDPVDNTFLVTQLIDVDQDGQMDQLIFQPTMDPSSQKTFYIIEEQDKPEVVNNCFSRIVPTRIDDYTWENDRVAFRTYGPSAQALVEEGKKGGIISSGIDCWLKKVNYPIIDKWYKASEEEGISYHEDHGEGLDNYHVGISRGAGGLAIKGGDQYFVSKNFNAHKTLATGPLRTLFQLDYADWEGPSGMIKEYKKISLDYGNNLMKIEVSIQGTDEVSAGISLQENNGDIIDKHNLLIFKQDHFDTTLSNVILSPKKYFKSQHIFNPQIKDQNHVFLDLKVLNQSLVYYVGFYWSESNQFADHQAWEANLEDLAIKIENPIQFTIK